MSHQGNEDAGSSDIYEIDKDVEKAKPFIEDIVAQQKVVTDRELKVRLEDRFFPWVTGRALNAMEREGVIRKVGYPGRKGKGTPEMFYTLYEIEYDRIRGIVEKKASFSIL